MVTPVQPSLIPTADETQGLAMIWQFSEARMAISSAPVGGGLGPLDWIVNIGVDRHYARTDLDDHVFEVAEMAGLRSIADRERSSIDETRSRSSGTHNQARGAGLLTAASLKRRQYAQADSLRVDATVGVSNPTWAADRRTGTEPDLAPGAGSDPSQDPHSAATIWKPGTINIVAQLPIGLEPAAAVNAIATITEAKTQALFDRGIAGTGTASDAIVLCWPRTGRRERFGGTRSRWGSTLANVSYDAILAGLPLSVGKGELQS